MFGLTTTSGYGRTVITLSGDLDGSCKAIVLAALEAAHDAGDRFVDFDLSEVHSIDAACVACLIEAQARLSAAGAELVVVKASLEVMRELTKVGYLDELT